MNFLNDPATVQIILYVLFGLLMFYLLIFRPQSKKAKEQEGFWSILSIGDQVVTTGGIFGKIEKMNEETVSLNVGNGTIIKFAKTAISMDLSKQLGKLKAEKDKA